MHVYVTQLFLVLVGSTQGSIDLTTDGESTLLESCNATATSDPSLFRCDAWACIPAEFRCNGVPDCVAGQDESVAECGCLPNEFRCSNSCIDLVRRCDREPNCVGNEDEQGCESFACAVTHFKCANHFCVPEDVVCNFVDDCGDNSDELNCSHRSCWNSEFRCDNGECIRPGFVCDGQPDCKDHSDEAACSFDMFRICGDGTRIHKFFWCDNWPECPDNHADELFCSNCTGEDEFMCPNGRCVRRANLCDSQCDCVPLDKGQECADEVDCEKRYSVVHGMSLCLPGITLMCTVPTSSNQFREDRCIAHQYICDKHNDCHNGLFISDEFGCYSSFEHLEEELINCSDGRMLPRELKCDFKWDCLEGEDESDCEDLEPCSDEEFTCKNGQCIPQEHFCDLKFDCWDKSDEFSCTDVICGQEFFKCRDSGQCVPESLRCDFYSDCPDGSDEDDCVLWNGVECGAGKFRCDNGQCIDAKLHCFNSGAERSGCADNSHLRNCSEWVCPADSFKCRNGPCISMALRCNKDVDCKGTWVDEDGCPFQCSTEPRCECLDTRINCSGLALRALPEDIEYEITRFNMANNFLNFTVNEDSFLKLDRLLYLDLSNNSICSLPPLMFRNLWRLHSLNLQMNCITVISNGSFFGLASLSTLRLQGNRIRTLEPLAFYGLSALKTLDLQNQRIENTSLRAFIGLRNLSSLDLSYNKISYLLDGSLNGMPKLQTLDISNNDIKMIGSNVFRSVTFLQRLATDEFRFCCLARHAATCLPPADEFSSCEDLMSNLVLRICVWVLGVLATLGNVLVIAWRLRFKHNNQVHSFLIMNLAIGDLFMGSYLMIIAVVDAHYRGVYFIYDSSWRSSDLCNLAGFISTFSSELSVFTLTVITLDRFLVIIFPFRVRRLEMPRTRILMATGWIAAGFLSGLPLFQIDYFRNFYGRSGVCLALHITPEKPSGWEYSVFVFLFLNLASFSIIALGYLWMYVVARTTQQAVQKEQKTSDSTTMARRMTLIVATDAACWMPIILLGILSLGGITVPPQVFAWVAVFVLPLNAAVNPILYTLSTAPFLGPARRGLRTFKRSCKLSLTSDQRRTYSSTLGSSNGPQCNPCECNARNYPYENNTDKLRIHSANSTKRNEATKCDNGLFSVTNSNRGSQPFPLRRCGSQNATIETAVSSQGEVIPLRRFNSEIRNK